MLILPQTSIILPTINEAANLPTLVERIARAMTGRPYEILVVDDASEDGTVQVCQSLASAYPLTAYARATPLDGLSGAILYGFARAKCDVLVVMDADLQHPPEALPALIAPLVEGQADFVIGSRRMPESRIAGGWGPWRRLNSAVARWLAAPLARGVRDPLSGFFAIRRTTWEQAGNLNPLGYKITLELLCKCPIMTVVEIPIEFGTRRRGCSKLSVAQRAHYLRHLVRLYASAFEVGHRAQRGCHATWMMLPLFRDIAVWAMSSALVMAGAEFGRQFVRPDQEMTFAQSLAWHDGYNYAHIATDGYSYRPAQPSYVAFFPAYPLASRWLGRISGWSIFPAMLVVSNLCGALAFVLAGAYLRQRAQLEGPALLLASRPRGDAVQYAALCMALLPATFFLRMAYTESMFMCLAILALYGLSRRWPLVIVAAIVGLATAVRPVGVSLLLPLAWYIMKLPGSTTQCARRLGLTLPLACWGLASYMLFQALEFHQPFAFAINQHFHRVRPFGTFFDEVVSLLSWEPIWDAYNPASPGYWQALGHVSSRLFSPDFMNPIYLCATAALIALGAWKRWLTRYEILLAAPLILIPYFTRAYEMRMLSQARFMTVVFPAYIVVGQLLSRLPPMVACALLAFSGFLMGTLAAQFAAGYWLI